MKGPKQKQLWPVIGRALTKIADRRTNRLLWRVKRPNWKSDGGFGCLLGQTEITASEGNGKQEERSRASKTCRGEGNGGSRDTREVVKSSMPSLH